MSYLKHLMESDKEYHFRIKMVVPIDEEKMGQIERILTKYELRDISKPTKTIIQEHPLDFNDVSNSEVHMVDAVTGTPVSAYILQQELRANLKLPEKFIVVRSDNDPLEVETARLNAANAMEKEAEEQDLDRKSLLSTDEVYPEAEHSVPGEEFYGNEHNSEFLNTLADISVDRQPSYSEPTEGLFNWLANDVEEVGEDFVQDDFNDNIEGVKPVPWWLAKDKKLSDGREVDDMISPEGNFDEDHMTVRRSYEDDAGKETQLEKESESVR